MVWSSLQMIDFITYSIAILTKLHATKSISVKHFNIFRVLLQIHICINRYLSKFKPNTYI